MCEKSSRSTPGPKNPQSYFLRLFLGIILSRKSHITCPCVEGLMQYASVCLSTPVYGSIADLIELLLSLSHILSIHRTSIISLWWDPNFDSCHIFCIRNKKAIPFFFIFLHPLLFLHHVKVKQHTSKAVWLGENLVDSMWNFDTKQVPF